MSKKISENKKSKWRSIVLEWERSGKSMRNYSQTQKFSDSALSYWRKKFFPEKYAFSSKSSTSTAFFKELVDKPLSQTSIEIEYKNIIIKIQKGFDKESLLNILSTLGRL